MVDSVSFGNGPVGIDENRESEALDGHEGLYLLRPLRKDPEGRGAHLLKGREMILQPTELLPTVGSPSPSEENKQDVLTTPVV